jgi:Tol biopolymer transport system component
MTLLLGSLAVCVAGAIGAAHGGEAEETLRREVAGLGWIVYGARSPAGDWDLYACRPDGSQRRPITSTPGFNEFSPQVSRDGLRLLYRRVPREEPIDNNNHGTQGALVVSRGDGSRPEVLGRDGEFPWASWGPDGSQIATLTIKGVVFVDVESRKPVRRLERRGFFQQLAWSPDGRWLCGVANSFGTSWSIARMDAATGTTSAVNRLDCCTPDWFPDSKRLIFSWRPPGQKANAGAGWTQLWTADAEGKSRTLLYGEDGRHVYGGHVSPDGRYVLFTGNMEEDGDPAHAGSPMGLLRLEDAPIIGGASPELHALHPKAGNGPVLTLPAGWEPSWTSAEIVRSEPSAPAAVSRDAPVQDSEVMKLAAEIHDKGWVAFSAKTANGDWDLYVMRPDGSERRKLTDTRAFNEAGARFSPDGTRLLYYRMPRSEPLDNNTYGTFRLVVSDADGAHAVDRGDGFPWASWGPGGTQVACLTRKGIEVVDAATWAVVRRLPRGGIVEQLVWSPDGKWFTGTANGLGPFWNIARLNAETGRINAVSETERYNCTSDWLPDSEGVLYARGVIPQDGGHAELWSARGDGAAREVLYAEEGRHIYGGCSSADGRYLIFTRSEADLGRVDHSRTTMAVIRRSDAPVAGDPAAASRPHSPPYRKGPRLDLGEGWEPHWTFANVALPAGGATR